MVELRLPTTLPIKVSDQPQKVRLMHKTNRSAKCHARCREAIISVGTFWLKVKCSVTVPLNRNGALQQGFCFCSQKFCLSSMPLWSNLRYPNSADADAGIADSDKDNFVKDLEFIFAASFVRERFIEKIFVEFWKGSFWLINDPIRQ